MAASRFSTSSARKALLPRRFAAFLIVYSCLLLLVGASNRTLAKGDDKQATVVGDGEIAQSFASASRHWGVPIEVLMAVGWVESHWEQRDGAPSLDNGYGIMHITDRPDGAMQYAITLTGLSKEAIQLYPQANIEAGAALLGDISHKYNNQKISANSLADWYSVVAAYAGATDPTVRDLYAQQVFAVIKGGQSAQLQSGEMIALLPSQVDGVPAPSASAPQSDDYPGALWVPANSNNYTVGRPYPPLDTVVIHDTEGSYASAISWFQNPASGVSAHYVIRSSDGQITQMVREANTAYHAGVWDYNVRAIGIEHEGYMSQQGWYTEAMYQSSAALVRNITEKYGVKKDRAHIIGHYQIPNQSHTDPGPYWDWGHYMALVRRDSQLAALVDNTDSSFAATPAQIDPAHYWWTYAGGYSGSNTYDTLSVVNQSSSSNSATWTTQLANSGYYDVYAFIPYVDNQTPDTSSARYLVYASNGTQTATISQKAITDVGNGSWAHVGKFLFAGGANATVYLSDWTGESNKNVWFDAVMWIPAQANQPPPTPAVSPTSTPPPPQPTATRTPIRTPTRTPTSLPNTPTPTSMPPPPDTPTPIWTPGPCNMRFSDLPDTNWAYGYVAYLYCQGAVSGYDDGTYRPGASSTRGQFAKILTLGLGWVPYNPINPTFSDVGPDSPFYVYVESAYLHGALAGYDDGTFRPGNPVTRSQAAKMLVLGKSWEVITPANPTFADVPSDYWAYSYVETAVAHGIVGGYPDGTFLPGNSITRAQLAKVVALAAQAGLKPNP